LLATLAQGDALPDRTHAGGGVRRRSRFDRRRPVVLVAVAIAAVVPVTAGAAYASILPDAVRHPLVHLIHRLGLPTASDRARSDAGPASASSTIAPPPAMAAQSNRAGVVANHP